MAKTVLAIQVETASVDKALAATAPAVQGLTLRTSEATAQAIQREAQGRAARRTGLLAAGIQVRPTKDGYGYVVRVYREDRPLVGRWLEFGTRHMSPRPFLLVSAKLEAPSYPGKVSRDVQAGIDEQGLGG